MPLRAEPPHPPAPVPPVSAPPRESAPRTPEPQRREPARAPAGEPAAPGLGLDAPVTRLPGVGPSFAQKLAKLGVETVRDLLYLLPHRYDDYSKLQTINRLKWGEEVTVIGTVWSIKSRPIGDDRKMVTAVVGDGTGEMQTWFNPFVEKQLHTGYAYVLSGKVDSYRGVMTMRHPNFGAARPQPAQHGPPRAHLPADRGLSNNWLLKLMRSAINTWAEETVDFLPEEVRRAAGLLPLAQALTQIHF